MFLMTLLAVSGCDRITGAAQQKTLDAEAIGYACRVSQKKPEACMKENETQSPSSVLDGWKSADQDIKEKKLNPDMTIASPEVLAVASSVSAESDVKQTEENTTEQSPEQPPQKTTESKPKKANSH